MEIDLESSNLLRTFVVMIRITIQDMDTRLTIHQDVTDFTLRTYKEATKITLEYLNRKLEEEKVKSKYSFEPIDNSGMNSLVYGC